MNKNAFLLTCLVVLTLVAVPLAWPAPAAAASVTDGVQDVCVTHTETTELLAAAEQSSWNSWLQGLSGDRPVTIGGSPFIIKSRHSCYLFNGSPYGKAFDYILEQVAGWGFTGSYIEIDPFTLNSSYCSLTAKNLILTIPGTLHPDQVVILSAHLDDAPWNSTPLAPGAEDNGSGSVTLLEAARLMRYYNFDRTIKIIWFTGEEQGLVGSYAYVSDHDVSGVVGVVNMDMFGYDSNGDRCFELHVGNLDASDEVGQCFVHSITAYGLNLTYDYLGPGLGGGGSDHVPFWNQGIGAVEILENYSNQNLPLGCVGSDRNPYYHTTGDTIAHMSVPLGHSIAQAGLATVMDMALPQGRCFDAAPQVSLSIDQGQVHVSWDALPGAASYRIYRAENSCSTTFVQQAEVTGTSWNDANVDYGKTYAYQVEAVAANGLCISARSDCQEISFPDACSVPPANLAAAVNYRSVSLAWDPGNLATSYLVERRLLPGGDWTPAAETSSPDWVDSGVLPGDQLAYRVKAVIDNGLCQTPPSAELPVLVPYQVFMGYLEK
jgi:hypothetical protein